MPEYDSSCYLEVAGIKHYDLAGVTITRRRDGGDVLMEVTFERDFRDLRGLDSDDVSEFYYESTLIFKGTRIGYTSKDGQLVVNYANYSSNLVFSEQIDRQEVPYRQEVDGVLRWVSPFTGIQTSQENGEGLLNQPCDLRTLVWHLLEAVRGQYLNLFILSNFSNLVGIDFYRYETDGQSSFEQMLHELANMGKPVSWGFPGDGKFYFRRCKTFGNPDYTYRSTHLEPPFILEGSLEEVEDAGIGALVNSATVRGGWREDAGITFPMSIRNDASITAYGRRHEIINLPGVTDALTAANIMNEYLEIHAAPLMSHNVTIQGFSWSEVPTPSDRIYLQTASETISTAPIDEMKIHFGETITIDFTFGYRSSNISELVKRSGLQGFDRSQRPIPSTGMLMPQQNLGLYKVMAVGEDGNCTVKKLASDEGTSYSDPFYDHTLLNVSVAEGHSAAIAANQIVLGWLSCDDGDVRNCTFHIHNNVTLDT